MLTKLFQHIKIKLKNTSYKKNGTIRKDLLESDEFQKIFEASEPIIRQMILPSQTEEDKMESYFVLGYPLSIENEVQGVLFIYQNPSALHQTTNQTTKIVFVSAIIAFVLTTFFAFFLSSKITQPLRKMREYAFDIAFLQNLRYSFSSLLSSVF